MKKTLAVIIGLALAGAAFAKVDPTQPMLTGHGNVSGRPGRVIVAHQTAEPSGATVHLEKFVVTGTLLKHPPAKAPQDKRGHRVDAVPSRVAASDAHRR